MPNVPWPKMANWLKSHDVKLEQTISDSSSGHHIIYYTATRELMGRTETAKFQAVENSTMRQDGTVVRSGQYFVSTAQVAETAADLVIDARDVLGAEWNQDFPRQAEELEQEEESMASAEDPHDPRRSGHDGHSSDGDSDGDSDGEEEEDGK